MTLSRLLENLSIGRKLLVLAVASFLGLVVLAGLARGAVERLTATIGRQATVDAVALRHMLLADQLHDTLRATALRALLAASREEPEELADAVKDLAESGPQLIEHLEALLKLPLAPEVLAGVNKVMPLVRDYVVTARGVGDAAAKGDLDRGFAVRPKLQAQFSQLEKDLGALDGQVEELVRNEQDESRAVAAEVTRRGGLMLAVTAVVLAAVGTFFSRLMTRPLARAVRVLEAAAAGDLTQRLGFASRDEVGQISQAIDQTLEKLERVLRAVGVTAEEVASSSGVVAKASDRIDADAGRATTQSATLAAASQQVSANVRSVAAAAEELGASIRTISGNAGEAAKVADQAVSSVGEASRSITQLGVDSGQIGNVVKVINAIAEQTNLLALNATIEAARAGEVGKGFAVVAGEVKELARETAKATEEIARKIEAIQQSTRTAIDGVAQVKETVGRIHALQSAIAQAVDEQAQTTAEIGRNVSEAARGSEEIATGLGGVARMAETTRGGAHESQSAAGRLSEQARALWTQLAQFKRGQGAHAQPVSQAEPAPAPLFAAAGQPGARAL